MSFVSTERALVHYSATSSHILHKVISDVHNLYRKFIDGVVLSKLWLEDFQVRKLRLDGCIIILFGIPGSVSPY